jgi:hypothetical protein
MSATKYYAKEEDDLIIKHFPTKTPNYIQSLLPHRTIRGISVRASRLGVVKQKEFYNCVTRFDKNIFENMKDVEIAYLAGIVDGEGCITISRSPRKDVEYTPMSFQVSVVNTNKGIIDWIYEKTNKVGNIYFNKSKNPKHKSSYRWTISGNQKAIKFLEGIEKYLVIKKEQANVLIGGYIHLSENNRIALKEKINILNKRG